MDGIIMLLETEETNCCHTFNWRKKEKKKTNTENKKLAKSCLRDNWNTTANPKTTGHFGEHSSHRQATQYDAHQKNWKQVAGLQPPGQDRVRDFLSSSVTIHADLSLPVWPSHAQPVSLSHAQSVSTCTACLNITCTACLNITCTACLTITCTAGLTVTCTAGLTATCTKVIVHLKEPTSTFWQVMT